MTARDPTPELAVKLAREKAGDFEWAFNRLVEILAEKIRALPPGVKPLAIEMLHKSFEQLHQENQGRQAVRNVRDNHETP